MHFFPAIDASPKIPSADPVNASADSLPEWSTFAAQRRRTLLFLLFAAAYVGYHLVVPMAYLYVRFKRGAIIEVKV